MATNQIPYPNTWYLDPSGKLFKVRLIMFASQRVHAVMVEQVDGHRAVIKIEDWRNLDLTLYSLPVLPGRRMP